MKNSSISFDFGLLIPSLILAFFGLSVLFSISTSLFRSQLFFLIISLVCYFVVSQISVKVLELYSLPIYIASLVLLFIVLVLGIESRGASRWLEILGARIQFSEILKPFLIIPFASFVAHCKKNSSSSIVKVLLYLSPIVLLIFLQPDLGSALIYILVVLFSLYASGFPLLFFGAGGGLLALLFPLFWHFLHGYQKQRILTFIHPSSDPLGTSYNAIQAIIAVGSGMFFGKGLGEGTQSVLRFLPERHTDFIFATLSEDFGFLGSAVVVVVFFFLLRHIFNLFQKSQDTFYKTVILCSFFLLLLQFFINLSMNIGLLPIVGVTLPFVSYGGSSLLSNFILLGILQSLGRNAKNVDVLEIR